MARQVGLGRALEIILGAQDFTADEAEAYGTVNKALEPSEIGPYVDALAKRIAKWPAASIHACKQATYASVDMGIADALKEEAYWLYQATSQTPAIKRFQITDDKKLTDKMEVQRTWNQLVIDTQAIQKIPRERNEGPEGE